FFEAVVDARVSQRSERPERLERAVQTAPLLCENPPTYGDDVLEARAVIGRRDVILDSRDTLRRVERVSSCSLP
ncbi:hypothetical protein, partial [Burkholderia vietnamiensis]